MTNTTDKQFVSDVRKFIDSDVDGRLPEKEPMVIKSKSQYRRLNIQNPEIFEEIRRSVKAELLDELAPHILKIEGQDEDFVSMESIRKVLGDPRNE